MRHRALAILFFVAHSFVVIPLGAQAPAEPIDEAAVKFLREEGLERSQVMDHLSWICDVHGPRLTGSGNLRRAQRWAQGTLSSWGLANAQLESWGPFGKGWRVDRFSMQVAGENPWPVIAWPKAWSPGLPDSGPVEVVSVAGKTREEVEAMDLKGKIVLISPPRELSEPFDAESKRFDAEDLLNMANGTRGDRGKGGPPRRDRSAFMRQRQLTNLVFEEEPHAILDVSSKGDYGTLFVSSASVPAPPNAGRNNRPRPWNPGSARVIPQFTLAAEHYNRMIRLLGKGLPVKLTIDFQATFTEGDPMEYNVVAEIPGTDPELKEQLVMLGAHYDSWHSGTGATDNGAGSAVMMEAMRLLKQFVDKTGKGPRRTIRIALWSGEEQGLMGSRAYASQHFATGGRNEPLSEIKPEHALLSGYFNVDNGTGRLRGVYLQGNEAVAPIFRAWLTPFHDLGAATLTLNNTGGTDHLAFDGVGLPGFQFIQDPVSYDTRTHHSNMDTWDHAVADDLQQAAVIVASFVWHTAQRNEMLPRKPRDATPAEPRRGGPR
jgi:hypothetical protein